MKTHNYTIIIMFAIALLLVSCEEILITEEYENNPVHNYEAFCSDFRNLYGAFDAKRLNWDSLTNVYSIEVNNEIKSIDLYRIFKTMLNEINDGHADLWAVNHGYYRSWNRRNKPYFKGRSGMNNGDLVTLQNVIRAEYLKNNYKSGSFSDWLFFYGTIQLEEKEIGYICIPTFNIYDFPNDFIQQAVDEFKEVDGVVIDLRFNQGGLTENYVSLHNRFGTEEKMYMKSRFRNGTDLNSYTSMAEHWVKPHNSSLKNKPIAILTNAYTASSSDHFVLAMKSQPKTICVGDTTCGAFSAVLERILPNGWKYRLGAQVVFDTNGEYLTDNKGNYLEGIGIAPDFFIEDDWRAIIQKKDSVLEKAINELIKM